MSEVSPVALQSMTWLDQALCLARLISLRTGADAVSTSEIRAFAELLALPPSSNLSADLGRLAKKGFVLKRSGGWALTPHGRKYLSTNFELGTTLSAESISAQSPVGADLGGVRHPTVPPELAPPAVLDGVRRILGQHDWGKNVMLVTRYPRQESSDPISGVIDAVQEALELHGLNLLAANRKRAEDRLGPNVVAHMWASMYGIGLFENRVGEGLNANVVFEVGALVMTGRRVLVVRDTSSPAIPSDITDHIYSKVDFDDLDSVTAVVHEWVREDLNLGACPSCSSQASAA